MKKTSLLFAALLLAGSMLAQTNLFDASSATLESWFGNADWGQITTSTASYDATTGTITCTLDQEPYGQWHAQLKLHHSVAFDATKSYTFSCDIASTATANGITIKVDDNTGFIYENQTVNVAANATVNYESNVVTGAPGNGVIVFDLGNASNGAVVTISNIVISEVEPEAPSDGITWTDFLGNGGVDAKYNNLYKIGAADQANMPNVANMQKPAWAAQAGIYMSFPTAADLSCSHACAIDGAGMCLYLDQFVAQKTEVTVTYAGGSKTFYVWYENGAPESEYCDYQGNETKSLQAGDRYCTITWNTNLTNGNVTVTIGDGEGTHNAQWRSNGIGALANFVVVDSENPDGVAASNYFTLAKTTDEMYTFTKIADLPSGAVIKKVDGALEWKCTEFGDEYNWGRFAYTYGSVCASALAESDLTVVTETISIDLAEGATYTLAPTTNYTTSSTGAISFSSSNTAVASVDEDGVITAHETGSAVITISQEADEAYVKGKVTINLTVSNSNFGPLVAPEAPTRNAEQVRAIYSDRYDLAVDPTYNTSNWGSSALAEERQLGEDHVRIYTMTNAVIVWGSNGGNDAASIKGVEGMRSGTYTGLDASIMEYMHVDIWCDHQRNLTSIINDNGRGAQGNTVANAWKSYDVALTDINHGDAGVENVRWMKFDGFVEGDVVAIANVYFYTTQDLSQASVLTSFAATAAEFTAIGGNNNITLSIKDQLNRDMEAEVTYTISPADAGTITNNVYTPAKAGWATITAHASADEVALDAESFAVYAYVNNNVALNKEVTAAEGTGDNAATRVNDGNDGTEFQLDPREDRNDHDFTGSFVIDLGAKYDLSLVTIHFEGACSDAYTLETSADNETYAVAHSFAGTLGIKNHTDYLVDENLANASGVRYIRFTSTKNSTQYGMKIFELCAYGTEVAASEVEYYMIGSAELFGTDGMKMDANGTSAYRLTLNDVVLSGGSYTYNVEARTPVVEQSSAPRHIAAAAQAADKSFTLDAGTYSLQFDYNAETGELTSTNLNNGFPTALDNTEAAQVEKIVRDGKIVIIKNGVEYSVLGARM